MPPDFQIGSMCGLKFCNRETGEVLFETDSFEIDTLETKFEPELKEVDLHLGENNSFSMQIEDIHIEDGLMEYLNPNIRQPGTFTIKMNGSVRNMVQARTHKKKRINKKWLKKYGYIDKPIPWERVLENCKINLLEG